MLELLHWIFEYPLTIIICVTGGIGNFLSIFVWRRLEKKLSKSNCNIAKMFTILAGVDLGVLTFSILVDVLPVALPVLKSVYAYVIFFMYVGHPLHFYFLFVSILMTAAISIDRLKLIAFPFFVMPYGARWKTFAVTVVFGLAFVLNIPTFFEFKIAGGINNTDLLSKVNYTENQRLRNIVFVSHCAGGVFIPWTMVFISNVVIFLKSYQSKAESRSPKCAPTNRRNNEHRRMTLTLLLVTGSCLLTLSFQCISRCIFMFVKSDNPRYPLIEAAARFGHIAIPLNSALNIGLFCLPGKMFRLELYDLLKRK